MISGKTFFLLTSFSLIFGGAVAAAHAFFRDVDSEIIFMMMIVMCLLGICALRHAEKTGKKWT